MNEAINVLQYILLHSYCVIIQKIAADRIDITINATQISYLFSYFNLTWMQCLLVWYDAIKTHLYVGLNTLNRTIICSYITCNLHFIAIAKYF